MSREIWKPLPGFQGYQVSSRGWVVGPDGELVEPWSGRGGELKIAIKLNEISFRGPVWKLVMYAFVEGDYRDVTVDYKDGDSYNLALDNLIFQVYNPRFDQKVSLKPYEWGDKLKLDRRYYSRN